MRAFRKLLRANLRQYTRERVTVFWTFAFPLIFIVIFGGLFGNNTTPTYDVGLVVAQTSTATERIVAILKALETFRIHEGSESYELGRLKDGGRKAVVVIGAEAAGGGVVPVRIYSDPTQAGTRQVLLPLLQQALNAANTAITGTRPVIAVRSLDIGTRSLRTIDYLVPGILAMALMQLGLFSAIPLVTQRETKVLRRLGATPLPRRTMIAAQVAQRLIIAVAQAVVLIGAGRLFFGLKISGSLPAVLAFVVLGALVFVAMGYVLAAKAKSAESAQPLVGIVQFPMLFLSGVFFPVELAPKVVQPIIRVLPLTYLGDALRQVSVNATALNPLWVDAAVLTGWMALCLIAAIHLFRWE